MIACVESLNISWFVRMPLSEVITTWPWPRIPWSHTGREFSTPDCTTHCAWSLLNVYARRGLDPRDVGERRGLREPRPIELEAHEVIELALVRLELRGAERAQRRDRRIAVAVLEQQRGDIDRAVAAGSRTRAQLVRGLVGRDPRLPARPPQPRTRRLHADEVAAAGDRPDDLAARALDARHVRNPGIRRRTGRDRRRALGPAARGAHPLQRGGQHGRGTAGRASSPRPARSDAGLRRRPARRRSGSRPEALGRSAPSAATRFAKRGTSVRSRTSLARIRTRARAGWAPARCASSRWCPASRTGSRSDGALHPSATGRLPERPAPAAGGARRPIELAAGYSLVPNGPAPVLPAALKRVRTDEPAGADAREAYIVQFADDSPDSARDPHRPCRRGDRLAGFRRRIPRPHASRCGSAAGRGARGALGRALRAGLQAEPAFSTSLRPRGST